MIPVDQEFTHRPEEGIQGDCWRACAASILEIPIAEVPHFAQIEADGGLNFWEQIYEWLDSRGLFLLHVVHRFGEATPLPYGFHADKCLWHIVSGASPRNPNVTHATVGHDGKVYFDPHPDKTGLLPHSEEHPTRHYEFILPTGRMVVPYGPVVNVDADEPSDAMMAKIAEMVPQDQFTADESI